MKTLKKLNDENDVLLNPKKEEIPVIVGRNCLVVMPHVLKERNLRKGDTVLITIKEKDIEEIRE